MCYLLWRATDLIWPPPLNHSSQQSTRQATDPWRPVWRMGSNLDFIYSCFPLMNGVDIGLSRMLTVFQIFKRKMLLNRSPCRWIYVIIFFWYHGHSVKIILLYDLKPWSKYTRFSPGMLIKLSSVKSLFIHDSMWLNHTKTVTLRVRYIRPGIVCLSYDNHIYSNPSTYYCVINLLYFLNYWFVNSLPRGRYGSYYKCLKRIIFKNVKLFNASAHFHKWGPKESLTLDNIGPHDIIIDHQFNQFAIRGQRQLSRLFIFHCCSHMACAYCVYNDVSKGFFLFWFCVISEILCTWSETNTV